MEINKLTKDEEVRDYMRVEHTAGVKPDFFTKENDWAGKRIYGYLIRSV